MEEFKSSKGGGDVENGSGGNALYPMMLEPPELRWAFIKKVYVILSVQLLLTTAVAATVVFVPAVDIFVLYTTPGLAVYVVSIILPFFLLCPLKSFHKRHPMNFVLLALFTISLAFGIGLSCARTKGEVILEAAILTSMVVVGLTIYTFWAAKRGHDFSFLRTFLFGALLVLIVFGFIQIFFPLGKLTVMIYGGLAAIIFCGYIVYDTDSLIKRFGYDDYIWAAVSLYIDKVNLFMSLLVIFGAEDQLT